MSASGANGPGKGSKPNRPATGSSATAVALPGPSLFVPASTKSTLAGLKFSDREQVLSKLFSPEFPCLRTSYALSDAESDTETKRESRHKHREAIIAFGAWKYNSISQKHHVVIKYDTRDLDIGHSASMTGILVKFTPEDLERRNTLRPNPSQANQSASSACLQPGMKIRAFFQLIHTRVRAEIEFVSVSAEDANAEFEKLAREAMAEKKMYHYTWSNQCHKGDPVALATRFFLRDEKFSSTEVEAFRTSGLTAVPKAVKFLWIREGVSVSSFKDNYYVEKMQSGSETDDIPYGPEARALAATLMDQLQKDKPNAAKSVQLRNRQSNVMENGSVQKASTSTRGEKRIHGAALAKKKPSGSPAHESGRGGIDVNTSAVSKSLSIKNSNSLASDIGNAIRLDLAVDEQEDTFGMDFPGNFTNGSYKERQQMDTAGLGRAPADHIDLEKHNGLPSGDGTDQELFNDVGEFRVALNSVNSENLSSMQDMVVDDDFPPESQDQINADSDFNSTPAMANHDPRSSHDMYTEPDVELDEANSNDNNDEYYDQGQHARNSRYTLFNEEVASETGNGSEQNEPEVSDGDSVSTSTTALLGFNTADMTIGQLRMELQNFREERDLYKKKCSILKQILDEKSRTEKSSLDLDVKKVTVPCIPFPFLVKYLPEGNKDASLVPLTTRNFVFLAKEDVKKLRAAKDCTNQTELYMTIMWEFLFTSKNRKLCSDHLPKTGGVGFKGICKYIWDDVWDFVREVGKRKVENDPRANSPWRTLSGEEQGKLWRSEQQSFRNRIGRTRMICKRLSATKNGTSSKRF